MGGATTKPVNSTVTKIVTNTNNSNQMAQQNKNNLAAQYASLSSRQEQVKAINNSNNNKPQIDFSKIASTSNDAAKGNFINESKILKDAYKNATLEKRKDGTYSIKVDGKTIGFTVVDESKNNMLQAAKIETETKEKANALKTAYQYSSAIPASSSINLKNNSYPNSMGINNSEVKAMKEHSALNYIKGKILSSFDGIDKRNGGVECHSKVGDVGRKKVEYTESEIELMARMVENECRSGNGRDGQVAVAEEIRNRVLSKDPYYKNTVEGVIKQGYLPFTKGNLPSATEETKQLCRNVLDGTEWIFDNENVLSHASHSGDSVYQHQKGVNGSEMYTSFYYDGIDRTQTFFTS